MNVFDFKNLKQDEVDFVIPKLDCDIPLAIDPFLLYKSRYDNFKIFHKGILDVFNEGIRRFASGNEKRAREIIDFPEVKEIGLGYGRVTKKGSGLGSLLNQLLIDTLVASPELVNRGVKHIEEMQLLSLGIGPDRISDISGNILKTFLIDYTQRQSQLWNIPLQSNVPINHAFDFNDYEWCDGYYDLPVNGSGEPILLVPRWIVRVLPWINFDDYVRTEFSLFLRAKATKNKINRMQANENKKEEIVKISRSEIDRIDRYIQTKENTAYLALPVELKTEVSVKRSLGVSFIQWLKNLSPGRDNASEYQARMLEILNYLFEPDLIDGRLEEATILGTERRDIIFVNDSEKTFFRYIRDHHGNFLLLFEAKNVKDLSPENFNQTATYLGDKTGYCGFILTRNSLSKADRIKSIALYNNLKRVVIALDDQDIIQMIEMRNAGNDPMRLLQKRYREFMVSIQ